MAKQVVVPRLGWSMEEGTFVQWLKGEGEHVRAGEGLFILEGDKAAQDVESFDGGVLRIAPDAPQPGATVAVGAVLGYLVEPGEPAPWETPGELPRRAPDVAEATPPAVAEVVTTAGRPSRPAEPAISPRARRAAAELGVDWRALKGSGRTGRIRERDVRAVSGEAGFQSAPPRLPIVPLTPARRTIAERMLEGAHATAPVTLTTKAAVTNLVSLREQFRAAAGAGAGFLPSYTDLMVKLVAVALGEHPLLNSSWSDAGIVWSEAVHVGIAVDTESGLRVPVLRDVAALTLRQVSERSSELIELARAARLRPEHQQGGTFTLTNLGMHHIDAFTPIINPPQCAILGLGRIREEAAVVSGQIVPRAMMVLSLTFDHRIVDGGPAARFLDRVRSLAEQPGPGLVP